MSSSLTPVSHSVSTLLRLPTLVRSTAHVEECLEFVKACPYALPSDKWLCALVRLQGLLEEVTVTFEMDDPAAKVNFLEPKIQYQLKNFELRLAAWEKETDVAIDKRE